MHLVIYFCGTNETSSYGDMGDIAYLLNGPRTNIKALFVKGCDHLEVCNDSVFPDLAGFAKRFVSSLFHDDDDNLTVSSSSKQALIDKKIGLVDGLLKESGEFTPITGITLCGYSRGAVTCFNVARELNKIAPNIPVNIVADNPVPGNAYAGPGTNAGSIADCTDLTNLMDVSIILGAYTGIEKNYGRVVLRERKLMESKDPLDRIPADIPEDTIVLEVSSTEPKGIDDAIETRVFGFWKENNETKHAAYHLDQFPQDVRTIIHSMSFTDEDDLRKPWLIRSIISVFGCNLKTKENSPDLVHRGFYSQIVPKLPRNNHLKKEIIVVPRQHHNDFPINVPGTTNHLHMQVAKILFADHLIEEDTVIEKTQRAEEFSYYYHADCRTPNFPRIDKLQTFFGITHRELYRHKDRLHPTYYLSEGYEFVESEPIIDWWNRHDKESSYFFMSMSGLTRSLIESIRLIDAGEQPLIHLFEKVDTWLAVKAHTKSSRYPLVDALRNNIYHQLVTSHDIQATQLDWISRAIHHEKKYFKHHWRSLSSSASFWKTEATKGLDKAFKTHAKNKLSKENDEILLTALNQWIQEKQGSDSKRWDIVLEMKEILGEAIKLHDADLIGKKLCG